MLVCGIGIRFNGDLTARYNCGGLVAPRQFLFNVWFDLVGFVFHVTLLDTVCLICNVLVKLDRESNAKPNSTEVDAFNTRPRAACGNVVIMYGIYTWHF